jgi:hypothetical protein
MYHAYGGVDPGRWGTCAGLSFRGMRSRAATSATGAGAVTTPIAVTRSITATGAGAVTSSIASTGPTANPFVPVLAPPPPPVALAVTVTVVLLVLVLVVLLVPASAPVTALAPRFALSPPVRSPTPALFPL